MLAGIFDYQGSYDWILVLLVLLALITGLRALLGSRNKRGRATKAVILLVLAVGWCLAVDTFNIVWRSYSKTTSPDGSATAWVNLDPWYLQAKFVVVRRGQEQWRFRLANYEEPAPERIFWLPGGQSIGVDYERNARDLDGRPVSDIVLDVFPVPAKDADDGREYGNWSYRGRPRPPVQEELRYFQN